MLALIFTKVRSYATLITAGVIAALYAVIKYLSWQRSVAEERAKRAEAVILRKDQMDAIEAEIDGEFADYERASKEDRKNGKVPRHLSDPDDY